jgi:DNA-binding transcriptional LysR family regulator
VGITELPVTADGIVARPLGRQELVAVLPPGSPRPGRLDLVHLARRPMVTLPPGTSTRDALDRALAGVGATVAPAVETDQRDAIGPLVLAGAGIAVLPRPMADVVAAQGGVVAALDPPLWRDIGVVHRDARLSPAARAFLALAVPDSC